MEQCNVVVLGAGLAGLSAARDLTEAKLDVVVLEARDRVGGRTYTVPFEAAGCCVDLGAEWVAPQHHSALVVELARYGIGLEGSSDTEGENQLIELCAAGAALSQAAEAAAELPSEQKAPCLEDPKEVERHFVEHHFEQAFQETGRAWVGGNIKGNLLSPGLLTLLRHTVAEERRYPGKLTPILCRQLSGRHVAVFKWKRKLKAGPSRPHPVPEEIVIADRPLTLLNWVTTHSGRKLELLWKDVLPEGIEDNDKADWYHDLHWLLNQGYLLLMADSTIHRAKKETKGGGAELEGSVTEEKSGKRSKSKRPAPSGETEPTQPPKDTSEVEVKQSGDLAEPCEQSEQESGTAKQVEDVDTADLPPGSPRPSEPELQVPDEPELPT